MASIRKKNNSYEIRVSCGYDVNGKQKFQQMTWRPEEGMTPKQIEKEVNRQAVLFEEKCKMGQITANIKFETFAEQWFEEYARTGLRSTSYERMRQLTHRVYPALGHMRIDKITGRHVQKFINDLLINGKNQRTGKPLSRKTVVHHLSFISDVLQYALKMDMISDNPCRKVTIPKGERKEKNIYNLEELQQLMELLETAPLKYKLFFTMVLYTGYRRSEMLGLEWKDIDWDNRIISVRRTSNYTAERGIYTDTTKTKRSQRSNRYPQFIFDLLKEYKSEQDEERRKMANLWHDNDRIFVKYDGQPMNPETPYSWLKDFCKKNDMRFCDLHSFRHAHASILINAGVDIATVSADLGHSNSTTTLGIYTHEFQEAQARTSDIIAEAMNIPKRQHIETA